MPIHPGHLPQLALQECMATRIFGRLGLARASKQRYSYLSGPDGCTLTMGTLFALGIFNSLPPSTLLEHPSFSSHAVVCTPIAATIRSTQLGSSRGGSETISLWPTSLPLVRGWIVSSATVMTSRG